jgi:tRNA nucleotidyltransferase (CCA-adding enzyme)
MRITDNLKSLSEIIKPLYIVGGAVRDALTGYSVYDIDLTGTLTPEEVIAALDSTPFSVKPNSLKLGTLSICIENEKYEYTAMREDSYSLDGGHKPLGVKFTDDIRKDALRRDFTVNALYYDITAQKIVDPLGALDDIGTKTLRTTREPEKVFAEDALRILRLARIACESGCQIEENTLRGAQAQARLIPALAPERIQDELMRILRADKKNNIYGAHERGIRLLVQMGAMEHIIPELTQSIAFPQNIKYHIYDVFEHILHALRVAREDVRLAVLFHDIAKPYCERVFSSMSAHAKYSAVIAVNTLTKLKFKPALIKETERLVLEHMFNLRGEAKPVTIRRFIQKNYDILDKLIALKVADCLASREASDNPVAKIKFEQQAEYMEKQGIPFDVSGLKVNGQDALAVGLKGRSIGACLEKLVYLCAADKNLLTRKGQLNFLYSCAQRESG